MLIDFMLFVRIYETGFALLLWVPSLQPQSLVIPPLLSPARRVLQWRNRRATLQVCFYLFHFRLREPPVPALTMSVLAVVQVDSAEYNLLLPKNMSKLVQEFLKAHFVYNKIAQTRSSRVFLWPLRIHGNAPQGWPFRCAQVVHSNNIDQG